MCCWRRVRNDFRCGCSYELADELIECGDAKCKFSRYHDPNCVEPACRRSCIQFRTHPQTYNPKINKDCPNCRGIYGPAPY